MGNAKKERGFDIEYQFGVSGFFIDIAIRHPNKLGTFLCWASSATEPLTIPHGPFATVIAFVSLFSKT